MIRKGTKDEHGHAMASLSKRENKKSKPGKELTQGRQRGVYQQSLKIRSGMKEMNTEPAFTLRATQELQSIRWMLLPLANARVATGHCRGQKYLNGTINQLGKGMGDNPVKGY